MFPNILQSPLLGSKFIPLILGNNHFKVWCQQFRCSVLGSWVKGLSSIGVYGLELAMLQDQQSRQITQNQAALAQARIKTRLAFPNGVSISVLLLGLRSHST